MCHILRKKLFAVACFLLNFGRNMGEYIVVHLVLKMKEELLRPLVLVAKLHDDRIRPHESPRSHSILLCPQVSEKHVGDTVDLALAIVDGGRLDIVHLLRVHFSSMSPILKVSYIIE